MMIPVNVVGGAAARELRQENRRLRRKNRKGRRIDRLEEKQDRLRAERRDVKKARKGRRKPAGREAKPSRASSPAPSPSRQPPMRGPRGPGLPGPLARRRTWDEEAPGPAPEAPVEEEIEEEEPDSWEEDEEVGDLRAGARKVKDRLRAALPSRMGEPLAVGDLEVRAPRGERGLVIPLGPNVFLMSAWPDELVAEQGVPALANASIELARQAMGPAPARVGDAVGVLGPLAVMLAKKAIEIRAAKKLQEASAPASPAAAVAGCRCQRGAR